MKNYLVKLYVVSTNELFFSEYINATSEENAIIDFKLFYRTHCSDNRYFVKI